MRKLLILFMSVVLILGIVGCSSSDNDDNSISKGSIEGYAFAPVGIKGEQENLIKISAVKSSPQGYQPLAEAKVSVTGSNIVVETDSKGYFKNDDVQEGNQIVTIAKDGFETKEIEVKVEANKTKRIDGNNVYVHDKKKWTYMVYIAGDNSLSEEVNYDINEMENVGSDDNINIIVQSDYSSFNNYQSGTYRYYVQKDTNHTQVTSPEIFRSDEIDSGSPEELTAFIEWVTEMYPAERYALILWDHGSGWRNIEIQSDKSVCSDDTSGSIINTIELSEAIEEGVNNSNLDKFDIIGFDACLMGSVEVAYQLKDLAKIMVASEKSIPGQGWPYDGILEPLQNNPDMTTKEFSSIIVDKYYESYKYQRSGLNTMAAMDLDKMVNVVDFINDFVREFKKNRSKNKFNRIKISPVDNSYNTYYDFDQFFHKLKNNFSDYDNLVTKINPIIKNYDNAIINAKGSNGFDGFSIEFSNDFIGFDNINYKALEFAKDTQWDQFLEDVFAE